MRPRASSGALAGQPILIGAVTVLIAVVATYLAYGANSGLPFVPGYHVTLNAANAQHLFKDADVRMAGSRIGQVTSSEAVPHPNGHATVRLHLTLKKVAEPLPADTRFLIQPRSYAGADYVDVLRGHSAATIPDHGSIPARQVIPNVPLEDFLSAYTPPVRRGMRQQLRGFALGFAGRGNDLNDALGELDPLLLHLGPAARALNSRQADLPRLIRGLARISAEVAPVAAQQANGFAELHRTFAAFSASPRALRDLILAAPASERATIRNAPAINAYLRSSTRLSAALAPAARELPRSSRLLAGALMAGVRGSPATRRTLPRLDTLSRSVGDFATAPPVIPGIDRLSRLGSTLRPLTSFITPAETQCRYASLLFRNLSSALREGPTTGTALRVVIVAVNAARNGEAVLASAPSQNRERVGVGELHSNPYPYIAAPGQPRSCQAGQESFRRGRADIGNPTPLADAITESPRGQ